MIALPAAVRTEALVYGDMSRQIKVHRKWNDFFLYTCVPNRKIRTENFWYEYVYRYTPSVYIQVHLKKFEYREKLIFL